MHLDFETLAELTLQQQPSVEIERDSDPSFFCRIFKRKKERAITRIKRRKTPMRQLVTDSSFPLLFLSSLLSPRYLTHSINARFKFHGERKSKHGRRSVRWENEGNWDLDRSLCCLESGVKYVWPLSVCLSRCNYSRFHVWLWWISFRDHVRRL